MTQRFLLFWDYCPLQTALKYIKATGKVLQIELRALETDQLSS